MLLLTQKMCLLGLGTPEIAGYSQHDSEINLPVVSRNVPRHPEWAYLGISGRGVAGGGVGGGGACCWIVLCTHGIYLSSLTD